MARKEDARRKIQFGGLVVKAGLDGEDPVVLLGLLVEAARALSGQHGEEFRARFRQSGDLAFAAEKEPRGAAQVRRSGCR